MPASLDSKRYNEVRFKASHNSYDRDEQPCTSQLLALGKKTSEGRCRGLELDLHQAPAQWSWCVDHTVYRSDADDQLSEYLLQLRDFSDHYAGHDVVTVTLDLKHQASDIAAFPWRIDAYIDRYLGREKLFTPGELQGKQPDLVRGAQVNKWPSLADLRGKFVFCLSGNEKTKARYARGGKARLCFADQSIGDPAKFVYKPEGRRIFLNCDVRKPMDWQRVRKWMTVQRGLVVRGYVINDELLWKKSEKTGLNILATDKVCKYPWASVGKRPFVGL
jgi:hypothetical protein